MSAQDTTSTAAPALHAAGGGQETITAPASPAQQRMWFIERLEQGARQAYHLGCAVRLRGQLDRVALRQALDSMVRRHEVLRTRFAEERGSLQQLIDPAGPFALRVVEVQEGSRDVEDEFRRHAEQEGNTPFSLESGPLIRGRLLRLSDDDHVLMLVMHHIVSDGWSMGILIGEVADLYVANRLRRDDPLEPLRLQYRHHAEWQKGWLTEARLKEQEEFWLRQLHGAPAFIDLPTDRPRPTKQSYHGACVEFALPPHLGRGLKALSRSCGATPYMVLLAAWATLLSRLSGQQDVVIGAPVANRHSTEAERLIGLFVNTLPLRADLSGNPTIIDLLTRIRSMLLGAWSHQEIPLEHVVQRVRPARSLSHSPLFQVLFVVQNMPLREVNLAGLRLEPLTMAVQSAQFDLSLSMLEAGDAILGNLNYATDLFECSTVERWIDHLNNILRGMLRDPRQRIGELPLD